jgi:hypothetical protein
MNSILPTSRQRGGSIFTMILFIMMLTSTGLMYYYFQRTRSLERDLYAVKNGEAPPSEDGGLLSSMPWNSNPKPEADSAAATAVDAPAAAGNLAASSPSHRPVANTVDAAPTGLSPRPASPPPPSAQYPNGLTAANAVQMQTTQSLNRTGQPPAGEPDTLPIQPGELENNQPRNTESGVQNELTNRSARSNTDAPESTRSPESGPASPRNPESGSASPRNSESGSASPRNPDSDPTTQPPDANPGQAPESATGGDSLYNLEPPPVKVRAPQRR